VNFGLAETKWRIRVGRQEVSIGRFVAIRDGTSLRRTFDGVRVDGSLGSWTILGVAADATRQRPRATDDPNHGDQLAAAVVSHPLPVTGLKLDIAALQHVNNHAVYSVGAGRERRDTIGARISGAVDAWDVDAQASYQFGDLTRVAGGKLDIAAWGAAFEGGYTAKDAFWRPRFALRADIAGGERRGSRTLNTFDLPYPNLAYLTEAAIFAPRNLWDLQPFVTVTPDPAISVTVGSQFLWRVSPADAVYSSANLPLLSPGGTGNFVASQPYLRVAWRPHPLVTLQGAIEDAIAGSVVRARGGKNELFETASVAVDL
jgi:hypothetical protein